jgi:hypothetical protein
MNEQQHSDFLVALGESFCDCLSQVLGFDNTSPQDGYEVFIRALGPDLSPKLLASITEAQLGQLRASCESYFEYRGISTEQMREVVKRILARWPAHDD